MMVARTKAPAGVTRRVRRMRVRPWINERAEMMPGAVRVRSLRMSRRAVFQEMQRFSSMARIRRFSMDRTVFDAFRLIKRFLPELAFFDGWGIPKA
ncbi:hypothetical protein [Bradyrhizobium sp. P5_C11_2]